MSKNKLWVFGTSHCLAHNIIGDSWADIVSQQLNFELVNLAQPATDNFFIYHCYLENLSNINKDDIVIVGWSHYSRKSFVLDKTNIKQQQVLADSIIYKTKHLELIRGISPPGSINKFLKLQPKNLGREYYDVWFDNYYSEHEQKCNQQSYMDSVELTCPAKYVPFFFSKESTDNLRLPNHAGYIVDFIAENNVMISSNDGHLNHHGHELWAKHIFKYIDINLNNRYNSNKTGHPRPHNSEKVCKKKI